MEECRFFTYLVSLAFLANAAYSHSDAFDQIRGLDGVTDRSPIRIAHCGETLENESEFYFQNPSYPKNDSGPMSCVISVKLDPRVCGVRFDFDVLSLETSEEKVCTLDRMVVLPLDYKMFPLCGNKTGFGSTIRVPRGKNREQTIYVVGQSSGYVWRIHVHLKDRCTEDNEPRFSPFSSYRDCYWARSKASGLSLDVLEDFHDSEIKVGSYRWKLNNLLNKGNQKDQTRLPDASFHIIGGVEAIPHEFPWIAALIYRDRNQFFCAGSLINQYYVITAGHCVEGRRSRISNIKVELGLHARNGFRTQSTYGLRRIIIHFGYQDSPWNIKNDIALLKLDRPVTYTSRIRPICMSAYGGDDLQGQSVLVAGWGKDSLDKNSVATALQKASFIVLAKRSCRGKWSRLGVLVDDNTICLDTFYLPVLCHGDSGGPVMYYNNGRYELIGVVSFGAASCYSPDYQLSDVVTDVSSFRDWVQLNILDG